MPNKRQPVCHCSTAYAVPNIGHRHRPPISWEYPQRPDATLDFTLKGDARSATSRWSPWAPNKAMAIPTRRRMESGDTDYVTIYSKNMETCFQFTSKSRRLQRSRRRSWAWFADHQGFQRAVFSSTNGYFDLLHDSARAGE